MQKINTMSLDCFFPRNNLAKTMKNGVYVMNLDENQSIELIA